MRMIHLIIMISSLLLVYGCQQEQGKIELGTAPLFTLYDSDSVLYSLKDYHGKLVMIHFWADWCPHCRAEFPKLQRAYEKLKPKGIEILAINSGQTREHVKEIKITYALTYPLLVDVEAKTAEKYKVSGLPTSYFLDKNGTIQEKFIGWMEEEQIISIIEKLREDG